MSPFASLGERARRGGNAYETLDRMVGAREREQEQSKLRLDLYSRFYNLIEKC